MIIAKMTTTARTVCALELRTIVKSRALMTAKKSASVTGETDMDVVGVLEAE